MSPKKDAKQEEKILLGRPSNNLKMGLVGLPNVGKSTTFNFLSKQAVPAENFPFCTIDPHEARMKVPDSRFDWLCSLFKPPSQIPANLTIYDIAGLVPGAHKGEGLGNAFLSHIASVDGLYHVVRAFDDSEIVHSQGEVNPVNDLQTIHDELRMKDTERVQQLIADHKNKLSRQKDKQLISDLFVLEEVEKHLQDNNWIASRNWKATEVEAINSFHFLTAKPVVYVVNMSIKDFARQKNKWLAKIHAWVQNNGGGPIIPYSAEFETKHLECETPAEKQKLLVDHGIQKSMVEKLIVTGYSAINLIHFFTCGEKEVRCWTIRKGTKAPQAAGVIHTDFEKGFICADVYKYDDLVEYQTEQAIKAAGKMMQKGKDYVVEDGDIMHFKFNPSGGNAKK